MGKEIHDNTFTPEAIKDKLVEINEQEKEETFLCKGCLTDTTGYQFQEKLCKTCALEVIAYSRKAIKAIDQIRPEYTGSKEIIIFDRTRKNRKFKDLRYLSFFRENGEVTKKEFMKAFNLSQSAAWSSIYNYLSYGVIDVAGEKFVGNRIVKVYRIKGN